MDGRMHYMFTRQFFPGLSPVQAKRINSMMDNRANSFMQFPEYDIYAQKGHRRKKHDMLTAGVIGMRTFGSENRDILFALWKKSMSKRY
jgi:hypothetical protein